MPRRPTGRPPGRPKTVADAPPKPPKLVLLPLNFAPVPPQPPAPPTPADVAERRAQEAEEGENYPATDKQRRFRATAERCWAQGQATPPEWIAAHYMGDDHEIVRLSEFERWKKTTGFTVWFYESMRWKPDAVDMEAAHGALWRQVMLGVHKGEVRNIELMADLIGIRQRAKDVPPASIHDAVADFLKRGDNNDAPASPSARGLRMDDTGTE